MLARLEAGARLPAQLLQARCAWLSKTHTASSDPMSYRGLLLLSTVYRNYAERLFHLRAWISAWSPPGLFSGCKGLGAEDG
eukprot:7169210-Alexandrium_andersonii.AAC.1